MQQLVLTIHILVSVSLIILVLVQHGKGADIGASFGSGASQTVFGSQGSGSFLLKLTGGLAAIFFATSLTLGYMATQDADQGKPTSAIMQTAPVSGSGIPATMPNSNDIPSAPSNMKAPASSDVPSTTTPATDTKE